MSRVGCTRRTAHGAGGTAAAEGSPPWLPQVGTVADPTFSLHKLGLCPFALRYRRAAVAVHASIPQHERIRSKKWEVIFYADSIRRISGGGEAGALLGRNRGRVRQRP
jgi:hypothetical protein